MTIKRQLKYQRNTLMKKISEKSGEALKAVLPIVLLVLFLGFTIVPISIGVLSSFLLGACFVIIGMIFFNLGAEMSMSEMGERIGGSLVRSKKVWLIVFVGFFLGLIITISEPDLQVLAHQVSAIPNSVLIITVGIGVGLFLVIALLRTLLAIPLAPLLIFFYVIVFAIACFVPADFLGVAFDSGGVTTGPMTVPFIMALGVGISSIRSDAKAEDDSFGLVALCSIGPILAVLILGLIYNTGNNVVANEELDILNSIELGKLFTSALPEYLKEMAISLLPILIFFEIFQFIFLKISKNAHLKICIGLIYTYFGLVLFMTGANVGFMPAGNYLGEALALLSYKQIVVLVGMIMGYMIVRAEPAVYVLMKQVEEITDGNISGKSMLTSLSIGVSVSVGLSLLRVIENISIFYLLIPGYLVAIVLTFFVPKIFTAIAFDSGGVASGPMTATFLLPLAQGVCLALDKNISEAFGVVAMVAMIPLITIQFLGLVYKIKARKGKEEVAVEASVYLTDLFAEYGDNEIIEL